ncbi:MAG: hypothetical protein J6R89_06885 [Clostridia bacterium]|nr:hypothetical protein [Clostridia bacterium]
MMEPKNVMIGTRKLNYYRIVYPKGHAMEQYLAEELSRRLFALIGENLKVVADEDTTWSNSEICMGKTCRTRITPDGKNTYKILVDYARIEIVSDTVFGYEDAFAALLAKLEAEGDVLFEEGECMTGEVIYPVVETPLGQYSFMFHNVWGYTIKWNPLCNRGDLMLEIYRQYMPDIIGMQEVSNPHYEQAHFVFEGLEKLGYEEIRFRRYGYGNPIYFNTRKLYPIECGYQNARIGGDKNHTWAIFCDRLTNRPVFAVVNSHFCADSNAKQDPVLGNEYRTADAVQMVKTVEMIQARYPGLPVITGGDYNSATGSDPINALMEGKMVNVRDLAEKVTPISPYDAPKYLAEEDRYEYRPEPRRTPAQYSIDHIMTYGPTKDSITFHEYKVMIDRLSFLASDHNPHVLYASFAPWDGEVKMN